jgi:hypothetical protein
MEKILSEACRGYLAIATEVVEGRLVIAEAKEAMRILTNELLRQHARRGRGSRFAWPRALTRRKPRGRWSP